MTCPLPVFSQSDYFIFDVGIIHLLNDRQTVHIQISWLFQEPTDLDVHCLQRHGKSAFSRTRIKVQVETVCMKCQILFSGKNKKNIINFVICRMIVVKVIFTRLKV